ncbi:MAG: hypothetical protein UT05_C0010G0036 [Parcubacteria group bacterium GW2011_GWF2_38_76]|nr:MAG: hypothetical protein UT05_C0010G0036 [Parcubacteria group bacterium GW2011_GWF2_38_76]HBM45532.1 hypothetical protein [Patescibacteria group bacterium]
MEKMPTPNVEKVEEIKKVENIENKAEHIPSKEEVLGVIGKYIEGDIKPSRELSDENGVYLIEVTIPDQDPANMGGTVEYLYIRKGEYGNNIASLTTEVHVVYYDTDGIPCGGDQKDIFNGEEWKEVK